MPDARTVAAWRHAAQEPFVARAEHLDVAVSVLSRAFSNDPVTDWFLRADARREAALQGMFRSILGGWALDLGHTYLAADGGACALFLPPDDEPTQRGPLGWAQLAWQIRSTTGLARLARGLRLIRTMERHHPAAPHAYLWFLGVAPERQGHGLGKTLLRAILAQYDRAGVATYLENSNPKNTRFYEQLGYREQGEFRAEPDAPPLLPMWRKAGGE
jgi:ribosomal protein S18 acetylase RimI-like enzyme